MNDIIHAAVRRDLARMEGALRAFPDGDAERARQLQTAWAHLWEQLHHHHESEDAYIWPYLRGLGVLDPALLDDMESEHRAMGEAIGAATSAIDGLVADPTALVAAAAADQVAEAASVTDAHLVHEETAVQPVDHRAHGDARLESGREAAAQGPVDPRRQDVRVGPRWH